MNRGALAFAAAAVAAAFWDHLIGTGHGVSMGFIQFLPAIIGAVGSIAGAGISAVGQSKAAKAAAKAGQGKTPAQIRDEALAGGFNPLTVLTNGGLMQTQGGGVPALSSLSVIGNAISGISDAVSRIDPMMFSTAKQENDLLKKQLIGEQRKNIAQSVSMGLYSDALKNRQLGTARTREITVSPTRINTRPPLLPVPSSAPVMNAPMPTERPGGEFMDFPVWTPDGKEKIWLPRSWADAMNLKPNQRLMNEHWEQILLDTGGELEAVPSLPSIWKEMRTQRKDNWADVLPSPVDPTAPAPVRKLPTKSTGGRRRTFTPVDPARF